MAFIIAMEAQRGRNILQISVGQKEDSPKQMLWLILRSFLKLKI